MNSIYFIVLFLLTTSSLINAWRWSRIAQREHYIPGYVSKFYFRWVKLIPFNNFYFFLTLIFMILSLWNPYTAILVAILSLLLPRGLSFNWRTSKVDQTERIKRLNTVYFILISLISIASVLLEYGYFLALFANVFSFFVYDQALKLTKNFEKNQS